MIQPRLMSWRSIDKTGDGLKNNRSATERGSVTRSNVLYQAGCQDSGACCLTQLLRVIDPRSAFALARARVNQ
jgi:hypothetical protein